MWGKKPVLKTCNECGRMYDTKIHGSVCPQCKWTEEAGNPYDEDKGYVGDLEVMNPVVGWIVCIEGQNKGRGFILKKEKNFIGRSDAMDVQILGDNEIAKKNHSILTYDPRKKIFKISESNDTHRLIYVNDEAVEGSQQLNDFDILELGSSKFIFRSLCGENFAWENYDVDVDGQNNESAPKNNIIG